MKNLKRKLLLIEADAAAAQIVGQRLSASSDADYQVDTVEQLETGVQRLKRRRYAAVLLGLDADESKSARTCDELCKTHPSAAVVALAPRDELGERAIQFGAQDYVLRRRMTPESLHKTVTAAIERQKHRNAWLQLSTIDDLTGLYNRRGLTIMGDQLISIARRSEQSIVALFIDLDGLKAVNDKRGHDEGDWCIRTVARILRGAVRQSDAIARLGGDEFAVIAMGEGDFRDRLIARIQEKVALHNELCNGHSALSLSIGGALMEPSETLSINDLLREADQAMYRQKSKRRRPVRQISNVR